MLRLRSSVEANQATRFAEALRQIEGVRRIVRQPDEGRAAAGVVFVADVEPAAADRLVEEIVAMGIGVDDYLLERVDVVAPLRRHPGGAGNLGGFAWVEVMGQARANSRPLARYLAMINVAAVIAALGVITSSSILIVGAMAVSPDLLPICATCVGVVAARYSLARRAFMTLTLGLLLVVVTAAVLSALLDLAGLLPNHFAVSRQQPQHPGEDRLLDRADRPRSGDRGDALLRDPGQCRGRRCDLGDDDPRLGLPRRGDRDGRPRNGARGTGRADRQRDPLARLWQPYPGCPALDGGPLR